MDELNDNVLARLREAIDAELSRIQERPYGEPVPAAFTLNFETETIPGLFSDNIDTEDQEEKNTSTAKELCRICLCDDRKLSTISPQNREAFQCVLGQDESTSTEPKISQKVCWECNARMTSFRVYRTKTLETNTLLYTLIRPFMNVSEQNTSEGTQQSEPVGSIGNPRCFIRGQGRSQPFNSLTDEHLPFRPSQLSFCVLQRPARRNRREPRQPE